LSAVPTDWLERTSLNHQVYHIVKENKEFLEVHKLLFYDLRSQCTAGE